jgi:hypothetical protein
MPRNPRFEDLTNREFVNLTVETYSGKVGKRHLWLCRCKCGKRTRPIDGSNLKAGHSTSCGCLRAAKSSARVRTHGLSKTPEHKIWMSMISRCRDKGNTSYRWYGARGIAVCKQWQAPNTGFVAFLTDMGPRPQGLTLERIDNDGDYKPDNCIWATPSTQNRNRRYPGQLLTYTPTQELLRLVPLLHRPLASRLLRRITADAANRSHQCGTSSTNIPQDSRQAFARTCAEPIGLPSV